MYLRFIRATKVNGSAARAGFFNAAYELRRHPETPADTVAQVERYLDWFNRELEEPDTFSRSSSKKAWKEVTAGISWFKPTARKHIKKAFELIALLEEHGYPIEILKSSRPGYIIYEDEHQIVAEPFAETYTG